MARHPKRTITEEEKKMFLAMEPNDITLSRFNELFGDTLDAETKKKIPSKFNVYDEFTLNANEYFNKSKIVTTCGSFIFNKFLIEPYFQKEIGYVNEEITKKQLGKIDSKIADAMLLDETGEITKKYIEYLNRLCWLAYTLNTQICSSISIRTAKPLPSVVALKNKRIKENKKAIENNDAITYNHIQEELVATAEKELRDDPAYELYASGARGSFDNAYRQWLCTKGPVWNAYKGEFEIITDSLYDGVPKENVATYANAVVSGFYPKAIKTGTNGYQAKRLNAAFQSVTLDERGSDCKTLHSADVTLTKDNVGFYLYHFIKSGDNYIRLEPSNQDKYMNKKVKIRLPEYCCGSKICNMCAGDRFYMLGITDIGLTFGRVANTLLNANMKKSHDSTVRTYVLSPDEIFV